MSIINLIIWYISIFGILGLFSLGLKKLKVDMQFVSTFFFVSIIEMTIPPWDCFVPESQGWYFSLIALWGATIGLIGISFYVMNAIAQKHYEGKFNHKRNIVYGLLIIGTILFYGALEDFSVFIYKGIHYFNPVDAWWHYTWFFNLFPLYYFQAVPGIILMIFAFVWSAKHPKK